MIKVLAFEETQSKYEALLKEHTSGYQLELDLEAGRRKEECLQANLEQLSAQSGKEIAALKTQLAQQNARLVLGSDGSGGSGGYGLASKSPFQHKPASLLSEKPSGKNLQPILPAQSDPHLRKKPSHI